MTRCISPQRVTEPDTSERKNQKYENLKTAFSATSRTPAENINHGEHARKNPIFI
jgi:hypothetical protein